MITQIRTVLKAFWYRLSNIFYGLPLVVFFTGKKDISFFGGFQELQLLLPFIKQYKDTHPDVSLGLHFSEKSIDKHEIKDALENVEFVDSLNEFKIEPKGEIWEAPKIAKSFGGLWTPRAYKPIIGQYFSDSDSDLVRKIWKKYNLDDKFVVFMHFDEAQNQVSEIYRSLMKLSDVRRHVAFFVCGSPPQSFFKYKHPFTYVVRDSFIEKFGFRSILKIGMNSDLCIGGSGGLESFFWLSRIPSINFFDKDGFKEIKKGYWPVSFWEENPIIEGLIDIDAIDVSEVISTLLIPRFRDWQQIKVI